MNISKPIYRLIFTLIMFATNLHAEESTDTNSDDQFKHWFVGGGVAMDFYDSSNNFSNNSNTDGYDIHAGYQPNKYIKIIAGYKKFGVSDFNNDFSSCAQISDFECNQTFDSIQKMDIENYYLKVRPEWSFDNNLLIYVELGFNKLNQKAVSKRFFGGAFGGESATTTLNTTETHLSYGTGVGYRLDRHELTLGIESYDAFDGESANLLVNSEKFSSYTLQYNFHF